MREASKYVTDDSDKYSLDLNALYKKYEIAAKAEQARNFLHSQVKITDYNLVLNAFAIQTYL